MKSVENLRRGSWSDWRLEAPTAVAEDLSAVCVAGGMRGGGEIACKSEWWRRKEERSAADGRAIARAIQGKIELY